MKSRSQSPFPDTCTGLAVIGLLALGATGCRPPNAAPGSATPPGSIAEAPTTDPSRVGRDSAVVNPGADDEVAQDYDTEPEAIGDEEDESESPASAEDPEAQKLPHPFDGLSSSELVRRLREQPESLGSASLGRTNGGGLFNAVQLPEDPHWKRVDPSHEWATPETIGYLRTAVTAVANRYPNTEPVSIGHLSAQRGGPLRPHVSHQSGRDVDLGFYYAGQPNHWYRRAHAPDLDLPRTWWLIRTLVLETDIEMILLDQSLISGVERYALESGEPEAWVRSVFHGAGGRPAIVRHASGHATHLHLRFFNPVAQESGRRLMPLLVERQLFVAPPKTIKYVARSGDTLAKVAKRYQTTMAAIRSANAMKTYQLVAGATYAIPVRGTKAYENPPVRIPARRSAGGKPVQRE